RVFGPMLRRAIEARRPEARYLRGGTWRGFAAKYRELGDLRAQMLRASAAVDAIGDTPAAAAARDHLYRGQANGAYRHRPLGAVRHALASVLRRRPEAYHQKLLEAEARQAAEARHAANATSAGAPPEAGSSVGGPTHGAAAAAAVATKEAGLGSVLTYDAWER